MPTFKNSIPFCVLDAIRLASTMEHPYNPSQAALMGYSQDPLQLQQDPAQVPTYSILDPSQYPESVAFWNTPSPVQSNQQTIGLPTPVTSYLSSTQKQQRSLQPPPDQKKHKRTRSGCFTCRSRRIKCDEARPVCDRCKKGNRDCVYPSASSSSSSKAGARSRSKSKGPGSRSRKGDSSPGQTENDDSHGVGPIADGDVVDEEQGFEVESGSRLSPSTFTARSIPTRPARHSSTQSLTKGPRQPIETLSSSPSTEASSRFESMSTRSGSISLLPQDLFASPGIANLSEDMRYYLIFHQEVLTFRHYSLRQPNDRFVHQTITEFALQYEPLLYAVVGFAAYHHCVQSGNGGLYSFLQYYNKALILLRESLSSGEKHSEATLVTVLVLTTFEEFSGDWVSLISHHQAAHALMRELLTPQSINLNELHSNIFDWYARFDVVAGILAGNEAVLGREWYLAKEEYDAQQAASYPHDPQKQINLAASTNRRFGLDMASLYAKLSRGMISIDDFVIQNQILSQTLDRVKDILVTLKDSEHTVQSYPHRIPLTEEDPFDPYVPGGLYQGPLWRANFTWIDYLSTKTMFQYQSFLTLQQPPLSELESLASEQCRLVEAIDRWPEKENGYFLAFNNCLGIASLFLPKDHKHNMWCRRKLVQMEQTGYIAAPRFRAGMATHWQMPELNDWWLPNDEGYPNIVREVRAFTEEKTRNPQDDFRESVRDMKTLFWKINLDDTESDKSSPSTLGGGP